MNSIKKYILTVFISGFLFIVPHYYLNAQTNSFITGTVISQSDNLPLIGATVVEMDKNRRYINATTTNLDGEFALKIGDAGNIIVVSFIGYKSKEFSGNSNNLKVILEEEKYAIEEVKVV